MAQEDKELCDAHQDIRLPESDPIGREEATHLEAAPDEEQAGRAGHQPRPSEELPQVQRQQLSRPDLPSSGRERRIVFGWEQLRRVRTDDDCRTYSVILICSYDDYNVTIMIRTPGSTDL